MNAANEARWQVETPADNAKTADYCRFGIRFAWSIDNLGYHAKQLAG